MRSDSTSSLDSASSLSGREGGAGERAHTKHSRKPQHVYSSRRLAEGREEVGRARADSLSVSVDWGALPSNMSLNNSSFSATPNNVAVSGPSSEPMETSEGVVRREESTPSTIVSLPLAFSVARAETLDNAESASSSSPPLQQTDGNMQRAIADPREGSVGHTQKLKPLSGEVARPMSSSNGEDTPPKGERGGASESVQGPFSGGPRGTMVQ